MATYTLEEFQQKIEEWSATMPSAVKRALVKAGKYIVQDIRDNFVSGQILDVRTGNLRAGVFGKINNSSPVPTFGIGDTAVNRGFSYPEYWISHGRDWVSPALDKNLSYLEEVIRDEILLDYEAPDYLVQAEKDFNSSFFGGGHIISKAFNFVKTVFRSIRGR